MEGERGGEREEDRMRREGEVVRGVGGVGGEWRGVGRE
jgi:hypothetical protein